ncbi:MAG: D-2-hydroxyacid dehydrogenase [Clostridiales Family XIII bacterium]|jgi:glycerate dehydrogenase|nr:D-2-hydroxyacid dehydrogenase [Clostridiales Family XIII bacterium]
MKTVILDGYTVSRDDLNWEAFAELGEFSFYPRTAADDVALRIGNADLVLTSKCRIDKNMMDACPALKYVGVIATGYNNIDVAYARERGVAVANVPDYSAAAVAQMTFALLLEIENAVGAHDASVRNGEWQSNEDFCYTVAPQTELDGKTFGVVGYGSIGRRVCRIAEALGMHVLVHTPHPPNANAESVTTIDTTEFVPLEYLLANADIVSLHCPLTPLTEKLISRKTIAQMKDGAILLNTARGGLVDEADLAAALRSGKLKAAGLDVLSLEPPVPDNPLIGLQNCIITPHIGWITKEARRRCIEISYRNAEAFVKGERLNRVD